MYIIYLPLLLIIYLHSFKICARPRNLWWCAQRRRGDLIFFSTQSVKTFFFKRHAIIRASRRWWYYYALYRCKWLSESVMCSISLFFFFFTFNGKECLSAEVHRAKQMRCGGDASMMRCSYLENLFISIFGRYYGTTFFHFFFVMNIINFLVYTNLYFGRLCNG